MKRISNKLKVILFLLVATVMTLIGVNLPTKAADENGKITVTKSATKSVTAADIKKYPYLTEENLQKGRYAKVNLNVSAQGYTVETESISALDIVLVFDSSNSMDEEITIEDENGNEIETTRMEAAKAAATDFATTLMANNDDVQIAIVEFGTQVLDVQALTNDENVVINFIDTKLDLPSNSSNGGTNLQAGIEYAETILDSGRTDSKKIVIILTDGTPTYFNYNGNRYGSGQANGSNTLTCVEGSNRNCTKSLSPISAATEELNELKSTYTTTDVYTIAFADSNAVTALSTINPESASDATPLYKNYAALSGVELQEKFSEIVENAKEIIGTSSKLTDIIPVEFQLPKSEVERLESLGIEVTVNGDGTTTLVYDIGNIEPGKNYNLEFVVEAKPAYYGTVYTNKRATLETTIDATNPYYCANATKENPCDTSLEISVDNPKVEIPTIASDDIYGTIGYAEETILVSTSILKNDTVSETLNEKYDVVNNQIVIVTNDSVQRIGTTDQYTIVGKGTLTVNQDGTFSFVSLEGVSGEITFDYYVATYTEDYDNKETAVTYSNSSTVSFSIQERELIDIEGIKTWVDNNDQDGKRPESITIHLYKNGEYVISKKVTAADNWSYSFTDLYKYEVGAEGTTEIIYTITEDEVVGYTTKIDGYNITNTHEIEKVSVSGIKTWDDNNDQDGKRPESITINLLADGEIVDSKEVTAETNWSYTFTDLDKYEAGEEIVYTITEDEVVEYTTVINGYNVTNSHTPEVITISGEKTWIDNDNQDGKRPSSITINLLANGEIVTSISVTEASDWGYTFTNLPKYANGEVINYTITEDAVAEYTTVIDGYNVTNTHEIEKIEISGTKTWDDNNDQDGKRPESITINLLADGEIVDSKEVTADTNWTYTFEDLDKYENGVEIVYTITEDEVVEYTTVINGYNVTNSHTPEVITISGEKTWIDNDNQDGKRPSSITINLLANDKEVKEVIVTADTNWSYTFVDLPKYANGEVINYTITEDAVEEYTTVIDGYNVTNSYTPEVITISGEKTWIDNDNQDGKRPSSITINLLANGEIVTSIPVTEASDWGYTFTNLPKYANGEVINYTITEDAVAEYTTVIDGYNVTNTHKIEKIEISGTKTWDDNNDQDGKRPESIKINLLANDKVVKTVEVTEKDNWGYTFTNLPKYANGEVINYTITEDAVAEYTTVIDGYNVTNTHEIEKIEISGTKTWDDNNDQDGKRPESITIHLYKNGEYFKTSVVNKADDWKYEFTGLDKYENGQEIVYTIKEDKVVEYTTVINGYDITNTHEIEKIEISGTKTWKDENNQDGIRPSSITVNLLANDKVVKTVEVTEKDNWKYTFTDLDKYENGKEIEYTITEEAVEGYTTTINGYDITNTHEVEKIEISGEKTWKDKNNQDGIRPSAITVNLLANDKVVKTVEVTEKDNWEYTFTDLDKFESGKEIEYTITEEAVEGYTTTINGYDITNAHEVEKIEISGEKTWEDKNNQDGIRPSSITVNLLANDKVVKTVEVTEKDNWEYTFTDLDKFESGKEIEYTITEEAVEGYTTTINGYDITNTHEVEKIEISGEKTWEDKNNQDGIRPSAITVNLLANDKVVKTVEVAEKDNWEYTFTDLDKYENGKEIEYTITEEAVEGYTTTINGYDITNTHEVEKIEISGEKTWEDENNQDGIRPSAITVNLLANDKVVKTVEVTEKDNWEYKFTDLDKYENGKEIEYTITEEAVEGYTTTINGYDITNTHEVEKIEISGEKTWEDENNQDGKRPNEITVILFADGQKYASKVVTVNDNWKYTFENLPKYRDGGVEVKYTVDEEMVKEYVSKVDGYNITNTYTPEVITVKGTKTWNDGNNQDGTRPINITINLYANGKSTGKFVTVDAEDNWKYEFTNLPKYENGKEIEYTITEDAVDGYTTTIDGFNIINSYKPKTTEITINKVWKDNNNQDGMRPDSITVNLLANDKKVKTVEIAEKDNWTYTFENLPVYKDGKKINYTITEEAVQNYETIVDGYNITNTHTPITLNITGEKKWVDNDNEAGFRPNSVKINLLENGVVIDTAIVSEENNWTYTFENLPMYKDGKKINYTVEEEQVENYETSYDDENPYIIVNTHNPSKITVSGNKTWKDNNNQDGIRPDSITVKLTGKVGEEIVYEDSKVVSAADDWKYEFTNLPEYKYGKLISYTIDENDVLGYSKEINGYDLINTHIPEIITISGNKTWDDNNNQDGIRPDSITINLLADDKIIETKVIGADSDNNWKYTFENLPKYRDGGIEINYTLTEETVDGYKTEITDYEIKNIHTPETISYTVNKVWSDYNNNDGIRPNSITVRLIADNVEIDTFVISEENNWTYSFIDLPKYRDEGTLITYEIVEDEVNGYTSTIESSVDVNNPNNTIVIVTNTHEKEQSLITINKIWEDYNNKYGKRPESITIYLYADGELVETLTITEETDWTAILSKDKYKDGVEIYYAIEEKEVAEYLTTIDGYTVTNKYIVPPHTGVEVDDNQTLYGTVVALIFSFLGSLFLLKIKLSK